MRLFECVLFLQLPFALAWWDYGHLLVAAVARLQLSEDDVTALETPLKFFRYEYPGLNSIVTAAIWPDHLKCRTWSSFCRGTPNVDGLEVFNTWHYVDQIYNPQNIKLSKEEAVLPYPGTGAVWVLSNLLGPDTGTFLRQIRGDWHYVTPSTLNASGLRPNAHDDGAPPSILHRPVLSRFTWNMKLRFLIHILGDLHQPLHAIATFSKQFPHSDNGGNLVALKSANVTSVHNLHALWDSCGGLFLESWPDVTEEQAIATATQLIKKFPREVLQPESARTFQEVAEESYGVARELVYTEFNFTSGADPVALPYQPSIEYLNTVRVSCSRQLTLGGYRLAIILRDLAQIVRHARWVDDDSNVVSVPPRQATRALSWAPLVLGVGLVSAILFAYQRRKSNRSAQNEYPVVESLYRSLSFEPVRHV